ncbi:MAG: AI-2E family transporter [Lachnospiraceae bacterium]|nr:AI-2E family transporter [Lachnospiraceae bacterium]
MVETWKKSKLITLLFIIGVVYFFLEFITPLVAPVLVAMLFVTIFGPTLQRIQKKLHVHRQIGAVILLLCFGIIVFVILWLLFTWIAGSLPGWTQSFGSLGEKLEQAIRTLCNWGSRLTGMETAYLEKSILQKLTESTDYLQGQVLPNVLSGSMKYVKEIVTIGAFLLLFVIATVFLAKDYDAIMNKMLNRQECHVFLEVICGIIRYIATFVKAQVVIMAITGSICAVGLALGGVSGGIFWGILAGVLDALPLLGTGIVLVPLGIVQLLSGAYWRAVLCIVLYVTCIFVRELLEPKLIGEKMGVPPLLILVALYAGIQLFGVSGIIKGPLGFMLVYQTYLSLKKQDWWMEEKQPESTGGC